jgi:hypothetical protein
MQRMGAVSDWQSGASSAATDFSDVVASRMDRTTCELQHELCASWQAFPHLLQLSAVGNSAFSFGPPERRVVCTAQSWRHSTVQP